MQHRLKALHDRDDLDPELLLASWQECPAEQERSPGTRKQYLFAVRHFLAWFAETEHTPLKLRDVTPITLRGYRNALQLEQQKSVSTINTRLSALRAWCAWLVEAGVSDD